MSEEKSLTKLSGSMMKRDETVSLKSQYFDFLDIDLDRYNDVEYTKDEARYIKQRMQHLSTGAAAALPLICKGPLCPFAQKCPIVAIDRIRQENYQKDLSEGLGQFSEAPKMETPIGKSCVLEVNLMNEWTKIYINEFEAATYVDMSMCRDLAEIEVMTWRINNGLSKEENAEFEQEVNLGQDRQGNPIKRKETHHFLQTKQDLHNRKLKLIKLLVGDRQEKYKRDAALKTREEKDPSTSAAKLKTQLNLLVKRAEQKMLELSKADAVDVPYTQDEVEESLTPESMIEAMGKEG